jgi:hypothetical protein
VSLARAEAGAKGGRATRWREEPCPAELYVVPDDQQLGRTFTCQRPQKFAGDRYPGHRQHIWRGEIDDKRTEITWQADL